jgi:hypothetical protein
MRVRAREQALRESEKNHRLTARQEYFVIGVYADALRVIDDDGEPIIYPKTLFDVCDTSIPPGWEFYEPEDGDYYLEPMRTAAPGLYEDYFGSDGDRKRQLDARRAVREMLEAALVWGSEADNVVINRDLSKLGT